MDTSSLTFLLLALLVALALGLALGAFVATRMADARHRADAHEARAELADAKRDASDARASAEQARSETAQLRELRADSHSEVSDAQRQRAEAETKLADVRSELAAMKAERDAAIARAEGLAEDRESLVNQFKVLSGESLERQGKAADKTAAERLKRTEELLAPLQDILVRYEKRLTEVEKERASMATDLRNQVQAVRTTGENLRHETQMLSTALRKPQVRGAWGEVQLRRIAEYAGMVDRCDFETQTTTDTSDARIRPDMRVNLTDGRHVFVDSKVPLSAFLDALASDDDNERALKMQQFGRHVRTHIDQLSGKEYWKADVGTPEFVVLFLPNESFLFEALEQYPDLHEYAAHRNIVIGTPNTLIAMLRAIAFGWKQVALAKEARRVLELGRELHGRLAKMGDHVVKTGRSLNTAVRAYNDMVGSFESRVLVSARKFTDLKVTDADLTELKEVDAQTRVVNAPELDAAPTPPPPDETSQGALPEDADAGSDTDPRDDE